MLIYSSSNRQAHMNAGEDVTLFDFTDSNADVNNWIESSDT